MRNNASVETPSPLTPPLSEILIGVAALLHAVLVVVVLALIFLGKARLPFGLLGIVVLFLVPVLGPLLVLNWNRTRKRQTTA